MHNGVKYVDRNNSQPPSVIVARGYITDEAIPTSHVSSTTRGSIGWYTAPFLPQPSIGSDPVQEIIKLRETFKGRSVALLLPLQIEGVTNDYLLKFTIADVVNKDQFFQRLAAGHQSPSPVEQSDVPPTTAAAIKEQPTASKPVVDEATLPKQTTAAGVGPTSAQTKSAPTKQTKPAPTIASGSVADGIHSSAAIGQPSSQDDRIAGQQAYIEAQRFMGFHQWDKAEQAYQRALLYDGSVAKYHAALGSLMMLLHRWADAEASYSAAVLIDVDNAEYRQRLKEARARR
jgi:hypothetical protein